MAGTGVHLDTMPVEEPRSRSASTLTRVFRPDPNEETARRPSTFSDGRMSYMLQLQHPTHNEDPPLKYHPFWSFSFMIKMLQVMTTIVCAGLYTKGLLASNNSVTSQMFPNIVFASYMIITPVILLSYVLGQKMPELLIRIFNVLGAILFFVAGTISLTIWEVKNRQAAMMLEETMDPVTADKSNVTYIDEDSSNYNAEHVTMLLAEGMLSLCNACLYMADVVFSIKRTLSYL